MSELLSEKRLNDIHSFLVRHDINGYFSKWLKNTDAHGRAHPNYP